MRCIYPFLEIYIHCIRRKLQRMGEEKVDESDVLAHPSLLWCCAERVQAVHTACRGTAGSIPSVKQVQTGLEMGGS